MTALACQPPGNLAALLSNRGTHGGFSAGTVIPGGSGGDVALTLQAFAQLGVGASDVLAQGVATGSLILGEIATGARRKRCGRRILRSGRARAGRQSEGERQDEWDLEGALPGPG